MDTRQQAYLKAMGIDIWQSRDIADVTPDMPHDAALISESTTSAHDMTAEIAGLDWAALEARVSACTLCELHQGRSQTVFGAGNPQADLLIIGEAPGAEEDRQGEPFVGRAGQLLTAMLKAIDFERRDVYITNILKCRPPNNRDPKPQEAALCSQYLKRQIELIQPRLILAVGRIAVQRLLQSDASLGKLRGQIHHYPQTNTPLIVTYHPAYLLRSPTDKRKAWQDLLFAKHSLGDLAKADYTE